MPCGVDNYPQVGNQGRLQGGGDVCTGLLRKNEFTLHWAGKTDGRNMPGQVREKDGPGRVRGPRWSKIG